MATPSQEAVPNEAGFSTNLFLNHLSFGRVQYTFRGATSKDWGAVLEDVDRFLQFMHEKGWKMDGEAKGAGIAVPVAAGNGSKPYEPKPVAANEIPAELPGPSEGGVEYFKDEFDSFEVTPQADNKASVEFFKDGMKWPVGAKISKWKNDSVRTMLEPLGDIDPTKAEKYRVAGVQFWVKGNEYIIAQGTHKGEKSHYKNLKMVQATL
jgi:hypothetical protein